MLGDSFVVIHKNGSFGALRGVLRRSTSAPAIRGGKSSKKPCLGGAASIEPAHVSSNARAGRAGGVPSRARGRRAARRAVTRAADCVPLKQALMDLEATEARANLFSALYLRLPDGRMVKFR